MEKGYNNVMNILIQIILLIWCSFYVTQIIVAIINLMDNRIKTRNEFIYKLNPLFGFFAIINKYKSLPKK